MNLILISKRLLQCEMMRISLIAALSENGVIGKDNTLPWHYPEDLQYFKKMTLGKPVIMGRRTFESMKSRPLPERKNIILTQDRNFHAKDCIIVYSELEALAAADNAVEVMVIGGAVIFKIFLPLASRLYLTFIHQKIKGDTFFPEIDWSHWQKISEEKKEELSFVIFDKKEQ
jgi:dihydrofolate reductase